MASHMVLPAPDWVILSRLLDMALSLPEGERMSWVAALPVDQEPFKKVLQELLSLRLETNFLATLPELIHGVRLPGRW